MKKAEQLSDNIRTLNGQPDKQNTLIEEADAKHVRLAEKKLLLIFDDDTIMELYRRKDNLHITISELGNDDYLKTLTHTELLKIAIVNGSL
jgi:hypothetical protein